jgi:hypothetical protein
MNLCLYTLFLVVIQPNSFMMLSIYVVRNFNCDRMCPPAVLECSSFKKQAVGTVVAPINMAVQFNNVISSSISYRPPTACVIKRESKLFYLLSENNIICKTE